MVRTVSSAHLNHESSPIVQTFNRLCFQEDILDVPKTASGKSVIRILQNDNISKDRQGVGGVDGGAAEAQGGDAC